MKTNNYYNEMNCRKIELLKCFEDVNLFSITQD